MTDSRATGGRLETDRHTLLEVLDKHKETMPDQAYREVVEAISTTVEPDRYPEVVFTRCTLLRPTVRVDGDNPEQDDTTVVWTRVHVTTELIPMTKSQYEEALDALRRSGSYRFSNDMISYMTGGVTVYEPKYGTVVKMSLFETKDLNGY